MKKFTIEYKGWESLKEDTGNDFIFFECTIHPEDTNETSFPVSLPLQLIEQQVEKTIPSGPAILLKIKEGITGWGPQESQIALELNECGIDVEAMVIKAVEANINLEAEAVRWSNLRSTPNLPNEILDDLEDSVSAVKTENENYFLLCTQLEKVISEEVLRLFPVILSSSSDCIRKFRGILVDHIPNFADDLTNLVSEAEENKI